MAKREVTIIPAIKPKYASKATEVGRKRRVAAYARVSTDSDEQFTSFEAQVDYYTKLINAREDWEFVEVYTDEGISGTSTKHRAGFNRMVSDALEGKIDLIVTKSISRFARNTIDTLTTVRRLKEKGVEVYFEKENIYTLDSKGELLITIMSSIAQEESRSISENVTWGQRKRFSDGKVSLPYKKFLGYEKGEDGYPKVVEEEAKVVRMIYRLFLEGETPSGICHILMAQGIPSPGGGDKWHKSTIDSILTNEKYKGDALLQKKFTIDFLSKKQKINEGEVPQYYVEGSHEAIVSPQVFDLVQFEIQRRKELPTKYSAVNPFSSRIICGECGGLYGSKVWHATDKYKRTVWICNRRYRKGTIAGTGCHTPHLTEAEIKTAFLGAFNKCIRNKSEIIENCRIALAEITDTAELERKAADLSEECEIVAEMIRKCVEENAHISVDQNAYAEKYGALAEKYADCKERLDAINEEICRRNVRKSQIAFFLDELAKSKELVTEFSTGLWNTVVDSVTVYSRSKVVFRFKGGTEVTWKIV